MAKPFKIAPDARPPVQPKPPLVPEIPGKNSPQVNEARVNVTREGPIALPWPAPAPLETSGAPMKLKK